MSVVTEEVSNYVRKKRINLSAMARDTGIPYATLYDSLANPQRDRELRVGEFFKVCSFLGINPMDFAGNLLEGGE